MNLVLASFISNGMVFLAWVSYPGTRKSHTLSANKMEECASLSYLATMLCQSALVIVNLENLLQDRHILLLQDVSLWERDC